MTFYGNMHKEKLSSAFESLPINLFTNKITIYDWGCGQGVATMCFSDYFFTKNINKNSVEKIILIEPSICSLRRASLHINKCFSGITIKTINKDLDSLNESDINDKSQIKIHLFSNILDVELFSLRVLINKIKNTLSGSNYFVCVSPNNGFLKSGRLDVFMNSLKEEGNYKLLKSINNKRGEWVKDWTRVVRVFKIEI
jgi:hypothetical protein